MDTVVGCMRLFAVCLAWALACQPVAETAGPTTQVALTISGMHCGGCADAITRELEALDGVQAVNVDFETGKAAVEVDAARADDLRPRVVSVVTDLGYRAEVASP